MCFFSIYNKFKLKKWSRYSPGKRQSILEKVEKKQAKALGRAVMPVVVYPKENWNCYGMFEIKKHKTLLYINQKLLTDEELRFHALETIIHEGRHAYQYEIISKKRLHWYNFRAKQWQANYKGYISSAEDKLIYGMQPIERDAQKYTIKKMEKFRNRYRNEEDYLNTMASLVYRYENTEKQTKQLHGIFYKRKIRKKIENRK